MEEGFQLREVINKDTVQKIAGDILQIYSEFKAEPFAAEICSRLEVLSFNDRAILIAETLHKYLPKDYPEAMNILLQSFGPELEADELSGFEIFYYMPHCFFVSKYGTDPEYFDISLKALYEITKRFSSESPIRPFLENYTDKTLKVLNTWVTDTNCHVRRLVSEGTRSRLPLSSRLKKFQKDPSAVLKLLEQLKTDPVRFVQRSVANNLNDISKDNADIVVKTLKEWKKIDNPGTQWIIKHALRTLIKQGHPAALELLGFPSKPKIEISNFTLKDRAILMGEKLDFSFKIVSKSTDTQPLMVDYIIHFMKSNGRTAAKVFKLTQKKLGSSEQISITKAHSFKPISTRTYYAGRHGIELQINGQKFDFLEFDLSLP